MTFSEFLSDRMEQIIRKLATAGGSAFFLLACGTQPGVILLLFTILLLVQLFALILEFQRCRSRLAELEAVLQGLDQKYLFAECAPLPRTCYEKRLFALMRRAGRSMTSAVSDAQTSQKEYREYVESWVHEIKTPITAARLICQTLEGEARRKLLAELTQIDAHVQRALFYARAESPEKDFLIQKTPLASLVAAAIQEHQALLIQNNIRLETKDLEHEVYTDRKWAIFVLGQLLQNSSRYRSETPFIILEALHLGNQIQLLVRDNGIGIPSHELARVCQRGFTGTNGRSRGGSTGMGLYLCQKLCGFLEIDFSISSEEGTGTTVLLTFPAKKNLTKL
ncbi:MAG: sensor histidine kinase [Lachnospiraceae bacterium]|jgi:signal transduction histidine kinase|nr:sensor histidine kinase [Lachnospiraceae bacterium]